jgi:hypothetical protein
MLPSALSCSLVLALGAHSLGEVMPTPLS